MKTKTLTLLLLFVSAFSFAQTIRRVNNNGVTGTNIYTTIQAAHDAAVNGDIIYVEGSTTAYVGFTCTKQLTFIGAGYFLLENAPVQADVLESKIVGGAPGAITFNSGSAGTQVFGFHSTILIVINSSNVTISRNRVDGTILLNSTMSNILISQNYVYGQLNSISGIAISGLTISNNIISSSINFINTVSGLLINNVFTHEITAGLSISNFVISNNIFVGTSTISANNNTFSNNISSGTQFPAGNGNLQNVSMANMFVVDPSGTTQLDSRWKLKTGSPAMGAGVSGVDCGAFGGANPYILSGIPPYPTITSAITSGVGNSTTPINVVISTKSN